MGQRHERSPNSLALKAWQGTCIFLFFKSKRTSIKVVTTVSAYGLDLPWSFRVIYPISGTVCSALETQSTKRPRLELYFTQLLTPSPRYTNVFVSGLGAGGWLSTNQAPLHLGHVLPPSQPSPALAGRKAVAMARIASAGWGKEIHMIHIYKCSVGIMKGNQRYCLRQSHWALTWEFKQQRGWHLKAAHRKRWWSSIEVTGSQRSELASSNLILWYTHCIPLFSSLIILPSFANIPFVLPSVIKLSSGGFCLVFPLLKY